MTRPRLVAVFVFLLLGASAPVGAYVRSTTSTGTPLEWRSSCPQLSLSATENFELSHSRLRSALQLAIDAWNGPAHGCTEFGLSLEEGTVDGIDVEYDGTNAVLWRLAGFCDDPAHALEDVCLSPSAAAITTVFYLDKPGSADDGELIEADIVLNADGFLFGDDGSPDLVDLPSVLTHELGHYMGFDHTCYTNSGALAPMDDFGEPVPSCFPIVELGEDVTMATMFNFVRPGETHKRTPLDDEIRGLCVTYAEHTGECSRHDACDGCAASGTAVGGWLLALGVLAGLRRAKKRASRSVARGP